MIMGVLVEDIVWQESSIQLAQRLSLPIISKNDKFDFVLVYSEDGLSLRPYDCASKGELRIDFLKGSIDFRIHQRKQNPELLIRAIGTKNKNVLDGTSGLGRETFLLASFDFNVTAVEKNPVVAELFLDAKYRADKDEQAREIFKNLVSYVQGDLIGFLKGQGKAQKWDAIYLDPMFPLRKKAALPKKELRILHELLGIPEIAADELGGLEVESKKLLELSLNHSPKVVVKRPTWAEPLSDKVAQTVSAGNIRFDIYRG